MVWIVCGGIFFLLWVLLGSHRLPMRPAFRAGGCLVVAAILGAAVSEVLRVFFLPLLCLGAAVAATSMGYYVAPEPPTTLAVDRAGGSSSLAVRAVLEGRFEELCELGAEQPWLLRVPAPPPLNSPALHAALLRASVSKPARDMARWAIESHPYLALDVCSDGQFAGVSCLHYAIAHRDTALVQRLLDICPQRVTQRATGAFFRRCKEEAYFGETPLHFAVATNQPDMVETLLRTAAERAGVPEAHLLDAADAEGNSPLHICVHNNLPQMYDHVAALCEFYKPAFYSSGAGAARNAAGQSPIALAAELGKLDIFEHLLERVTVCEWRMGPCNCRRLWLDDLDPVASGATASQGVLKMLVDRSHSELLMLPAVREILQLKWDAFARQVASRNLLWLLLYVAMFSSLVLWGPMVRERDAAEQYCAELESGGSWWGGDLRDGVLMDVWCELGVYPFQRTCEFAVVCGVLLGLRRELQLLLRVPWRDHFGRAGSMLAEQLLSYSFAIAVLLAVVWRGLGVRQCEDLCLACAALLLWSLVLHQLLGFRGTGPFIVMIWKMLGSDLIRFLCIFCAFLFGFTQALYLLMNRYGATHFLSRLMGCFTALLGQTDIMTLVVHSDASPYPLFSTGLLLAYILLVSVLLLNLLIAMMTTTYSKVYEESDKVWNLEWARKIIAIEGRLSDGERARCRYWGEDRRSGRTRRYLLLPGTRPEDRAQFRGRQAVWPALTGKRAAQLY
eukprot:TRINITY_DN36381_c0_g1_i2.p1 TRINITY_DN36381_c0_g1~~TRINITY_DN36381_c0_g1_i2.p1  ORF type:complete len:732 (+),score=130.59 TRINITY_DN36381_c0_g1_i2:1385-3580(+)